MSVDLKAQRLFSLSGEELLCKQFHLDTSADNMDIKAISSFSFEDFRDVETINLRFPPVISSKKCEVDTKVIFWLKNVRLTHNSTPDVRRGRGCVIKVDWGMLRELRV